MRSSSLPRPQQDIKEKELDGAWDSNAAEDAPTECLVDGCDWTNILVERKARTSLHPSLLARATELHNRVASLKNTDRITETRTVCTFLMD
jgi:hypothetical protein